MSDILIAAHIANDGKNTIVVSNSSDAANWCYNNIPQQSQGSPALAVLNGNLWSAFRGNSSTKIYSASLTNWEQNNFTGQSSQLAPSLAAFIGKLWMAYIGESSGQVEVISSSDGTHWSGSSLTGQSSKASPAIVAMQGTLWIAYLGESSSQVEVISSTDGVHWSGKTLTGQSSKVAPAACTFSASIQIAYIGASSGNVEMISTNDGTNWTGKTLTGQSSNISPALAEINGSLQLAYIGKSSGNLELISSTDGVHWSPDYSTGRGSKVAPSLVVVQAVTPPNHFGGSVQYVFSCPTKSGDPSVPLTPLLDLVVQIQITEALVVSPTSGFSKKGITTPQPISFQINGFSQKGDSTICWQQYGLSMTPNSNLLNSFAENWPLNSKAPNVFNLNSSSTITLPSTLIIPAGLTFRLTFKYQGNTISGFNCSVTNSSGANVGNLNMDLIGQPLAAGGTIQSNDLAEIVAFQVILVGWANSANATLISGAGTILCTSSTVMTPGTAWPQDSDGVFGTAENANSTYGLVPIQASTSIPQVFGISS